MKPRFIWLLLTCCVLVPGARAQLPDAECLKCHGMDWIVDLEPTALAAMVKLPDDEPLSLRSADTIDALYTPGDSFEGSAHAAQSCAECHPDADRLPHAQHLADVACGDCHEEATQAVALSAHSPASDGSTPSCADCHGKTHEMSAIDRPRSHSRTAGEAEACMTCHDQPDADGHDPSETYRHSVHGKAVFDKGLAVAANCVDCHGAHGVASAASPDSPTNPLRVHETCAKCHDGIADIYFDSVHGQRLLAGDEEAANCTSCHSEHGVAQVDDEYMLSVVEECSTCHLDLGRTYLASYHGKATMLGDASSAVCSSCHGAHDIQPKEHPDSNVAAVNLVETCSKCHDGVNENFVQYIPHVDFRDRTAHPQVFYTWLLMTCMLCGVLAFFIPHSLMWFQRAIGERLRSLRGYHMAAEHVRWVLRFRPIHRITHAMIVVSFMGLVLTGFPLKYSYTEWAQGLASLLGGARAMGLLHRGFALLTFAYAAVHIAFLARFFFQRPPREWLRFAFGPDSMIFSLRDLKDFFAMMLWFLRLGPRPRFDRWTYYEKFDYWGEIWGIFVIGSTGMVLWAPMFFTRWLPGWVLNCAIVVHSIEALLAASVIFLVHFFNTHMRPEKFPIDMVMLTGRMTEQEMIDERPDEYRRLHEAGQLEQRIVKPTPFKWRVVGAIAGLMAFLLGTALIALAMKTEIRQILG